MNPIPGIALPNDRSVVLLADDEPQIRNLMSAVLRSHGLAVFSAPNATEALRLSRHRSRRIDLLITDVEMGEPMNGFTLAEVMRRERPGLAVLIVAGTPQLAALAAGKHLPFLQKPFTLPAFTERVREALSPGVGETGWGGIGTFGSQGIRSLIEERRQLEHDLLDQLGQSAEAYRNAAVRARVLLEHAREIGLDSPNGAHVSRLAAVSERFALEKYQAALKALTDAFRAAGMRPRRELLESLLDTAVDAARASKGIIQVLDPAERVLTIAAQHGFDQPFLAFFRRVPAGVAACGHAFETAQRVVVEDITASPIFRGQASQSVLLEAGVRAVASTPLTGPSGNPVGVLSTHYAEPTQPTVRDLELMDALARETAVLVASLHGNEIPAEGALSGWPAESSSANESRRRASPRTRRRG